MLELKDVVEVAFANSFHANDVAYFHSKTNCHNLLFHEVFPDANFKPKHRIVSHYAQLIRVVLSAISVPCTLKQNMHFSSRLFVISKFQEYIKHAGNKS